MNWSALLHLIPAFLRNVIIIALLLLVAFMIVRWFR